MSYGLTFHETPADAVERVRREQLAAAAESLHDGDETVELLAERFVGQYPKTFFAGVRQPLATHARALRGEADPAAHADVLSGLAQDSWPLAALDPDAIAGSLERTYARGRDAFARADRKPTTTNLH